MAVVTDVLAVGDAVSLGIWLSVLAFHVHAVLRVKHPFGRLVTLRAMLSSYLAMALNPVALLQYLAMSGGGLIATLRGVFTKDTAPPAFICAPPLSGAWYVLNGGTTKQTSHSWNLACQRYAYDFIKPPAPELRDHSAFHQPEDYPAFGAPVLAPADGRVIETRDGSRDGPWVGKRTGWVWPWFRDLRGNYVVIEHEIETGRLYSLLAHLKRGSICVARGQRVSAGQCVGRCGNSGQSTEPHLHIHVQDTRVMWWARGVPIVFAETGAAPATAHHSLTRGQTASFPEDSDGKVSR